MRGLAAVLVALLQLDVVGQRVLDETLADWCHEAGRARSVGGRTWCAVRGGWALVGSVARLAVHDLRLARTWTTVAGLFGGALAWSAVFAIPALLRLLTGANRVELGAAELLLFFVPALSVAWPLATLTPPLVERGSHGILGVGLVVTVVAVVSVGWIIPTANQMLRETVFVRFGIGLLAEGPAERSLLELTRDMRTAGLAGMTALWALSDRLAIVAMSPAFLLLGASIRQAFRRQRAVVALLCAWGMALAAMYSGGFAMVELREWLRSLGHPADAVRLMQVWVTPLLAMGIAVALTVLGRSEASLVRWSRRENA